MASIEEGTAKYTTIEALENRPVFTIRKNEAQTTKIFAYKLNDQVDNKY